MEKEKRKNKLKKLILLVFSVLVMTTGIIGTSTEVQAAGTTYDLGQGWTMRLDTPGMDSKPYYHIHFYYKKAPKYCLRLDTLQPCDGYKSNPVPNWAMKEAKNKVGSKWGSAISPSTISWGKSLATAGCVLLVIVATICPFDGPVGDSVAWGLLLGVV
ncbi:hypothetical protein LAD12857_47930 [Lacrimispora amygdalina]|uniref:Uncharacterized protein n=1 Tax=Lacrimispora amygdalina TaxID=253257 RepID=A0A3E2N4Q7_9FIRM|nr:hypothetical protein [Clostridium indicum]RFZ75881.1 hypothetical protein DS742_26645 [Clostridium indicum]